MKVSFGRLAALLMVCGAAAACRPDIQPVQGTLEPGTPAAEAPAAVRETLETAPLDDRFEYLLNDGENGLAVLSLLRCSEGQSAEGYGVLVVCGDTRTELPGIRHGNMPQARFDAAKGELWLTGADTEGTGLRVERPYLLRFDPAGHASVAATIDPYAMQEEFRKHLSFSVKNKNITFYADGAPLVTSTVTEDGMGPLFDQPVWIGEQIRYELDGGLTVLVTPGLSFQTGKVLLYDDTPTLAATVALTPEGFTLSGFRIYPEL